MSKRILVVDDNADIREMMQVYISSLGLTVFSAGDGIEGIEAAKTHIPDLIVTDATMPKMDGIEMTNRLRALPQFISTPIIIVTGKSSTVEDEAVRLGPTLVLLKPVPPTSLAAKINELLPQAS
jgi:two-component system chemotaxis response regulator CheY